MTFLQDLGQGPGKDFEEEAQQLEQGRVDSDWRRCPMLTRRQVKKTQCVDCCPGCLQGSGTSCSENGPGQATGAAKIAVSPRAKQTCCHRKQHRRVRVATRWSVTQTVPSHSLRCVACARNLRRGRGRRSDHCGGLLRKVMFTCSDDRPRQELATPPRTSESWLVSMYGCVHRSPRAEQLACRKRVSSLRPLPTGSSTTGLSFCTPACFSEALPANPPRAP